MKILSLELKGAIRLELSQVDYIKITPETSIMAVIGSNGSGKSSLLYYLSPNVPDKHDFRNDGFKKIRIQHNNEIFCLTNDFSTHKHSFYNESNNTELNIGGTSTMQKQLVKDYFNYNEKIHALLIGKEKFTSMSPAKRKEWFTTLCDCDYTFALNLYNETKDKHRDAVGALKKLNQHRMQLTDNYVDVSKQLEEINFNIREKENKVNQLALINPHKIEYNNPLYKDDMLDNLKQHQENVEKQRCLSLQYAYRLAKENITETYYQERLLDREVLNQHIGENKGSYVAMVSEYGELEQRVTTVKVANEEEMIFYKSKQNDLLKELDELKEMREKNLLSLPETHQFNNSHVIDLNNIFDVYPILKDVDGEVQDKIHEIDLLGIQQAVKKEDVLTAENELAELKNKLVKLNHAILDTHNRLSVMRENEAKEKVQCPNCEHDFHPGFKKEIYQKLMERQAHLDEQKVLLDEKIQKQTEVYTTLNHHYTKLKDLLTFCMNNRMLLSGWIKVYFGQLCYLNQGVSGLVLWMVFKNDLDYLYQMKQVQRQIDDLNKLLDNTNYVDEKNLKQMHSHLASLEQKIRDLKIQLKEDEAYLQEINRTIKLYESFQSTKHLLEEEINKTMGLVDELIVYDFYSLMSGFISQERNEIALLSKKQMEILTREKNIEMVNQQISDLEKEIAVLDCIMDALNPNDGLIAQGLLGYIRVFLSRLNGFIQSIWTYPLIVHPAKANDNKDDELNYRFPMTVGLSEKPKTDIALGSDGILEIIDLAFKMIAMKSLKLHGYPIFLDEFGRTFDAKHRENALRLIEKLSEEFIEDQIFIVSHNFMEYSVLNDVSFCVLSEDNIVLPPNNLNKGVEISRF